MLCIHGHVRVRMELRPLARTGHMLQAARGVWTLTAFELGPSCRKIFEIKVFALAAPALQHHLCDITYIFLEHHQFKNSFEGFLRASEGYCGYIERHTLHRFQIFTSQWAFAAFAYFLYTHSEGTSVARQSTARFIRGLFAAEGLFCLLGICGNTTP